MRPVYKAETNCFPNEIAAIPARPTLPPSQLPLGRSTVKRMFRLAVDAFMAVRMQRAHAKLVEQLDERTLRDIGMDLEANRARERNRLAMRFGGY